MAGFYEESGSSKGTCPWDPEEYTDIPMGVVTPVIRGPTGAHVGSHVGGYYGGRVPIAYYIFLYLFIYFISCVFSLVNNYDWSDSLRLSGCQST